MALTGPMMVHAQSVGNEETETELRSGPIEVDDADDIAEEDIRVAIPSYIDLANNKIRLNGADWTTLSQSLAVCGSDPFTIVHIGDSHLQADFATSVTRRLLQAAYGDAGRGLISPLKISGTNQPTDYEFSSHDLWHSIKLMKQPWKMTMGFTGTSITPDRKSARLTIGLKQNDEEYSPFSTLVIFHHGRLKVNEITDMSGTPVKFVSFPSKDYTEINLGEPQTNIELQLTGAADLTVFGVSLSGDRPGVFYHTIGNNGATYSVYNNIGTVGKGIAPLQPDLVIISLGTNEAFGKVNRATVYDNIDALVDEVRLYNPEARILLVTPMECQRSEYRTTTRRQRVSGRKGKKGKRKSRTVNKRVKVRTGSYAVNPNVATVRDIINQYAADNHIAVYDWYEIAGGQGASTKWVSDGLFSKDRIHHSRKGYALQGELMYEALKEALDPTGSAAPLPSLLPVE